MSRYKHLEETLQNYKDRFVRGTPLYGLTHEDYNVYERKLFYGLHFRRVNYLEFRDTFSHLFEDSPNKLYLVLDYSYKNFPVIKIGVSGDPETRVKQLKTRSDNTGYWRYLAEGESKSLRIVRVFEGMNQLDEMILHNVFRKKRRFQHHGKTRTEYFQLNAKDINFIEVIAAWVGAKKTYSFESLDEALSVTFIEPSVLPPVKKIIKTQSNQY